MEKIISLDYFFTNLLNKLIPHNILFDYFFSFFSIIGLTTLIWIILALLLIIFEEVKHKKFIIYFAISLITTALVVNVIKNFIHRPRPQLISINFNKFLLISNVCPLDFSFPSVHAATAFAAAAVLTYFDKKRKWFYYTVALLISYSRIYLGCHYFLDVIIGAIIGHIISQALLFVRDTSPFRRRS